MKFENILEDELKDIDTRRKCHGLDNDPKDLVGLALSGGGVRSASFNLGLLQSLVRSGLLKYIDYVSTVSGGGYIGSFLASLPLKLGKEKSSSVHEVDKELRRQLVPSPEQPGQPKRVVQMVRNGKYLNRPDSFTNLYLIGLLLNNLAMFSGLATVCMLLAYLWRCLDSNDFGNWLYLNLPPGRWWIELYRPFLPAIVVFTLWLLAWVVEVARGLWKGQRPKTRSTRFLLICGAVALLIGVAVVLATPVISIPDVGSDVGPNNNSDDGVREVSDHQHVIATTLFGLILAALTPFLRLDRLLQSGIHPKSIWERRVFQIASSALLVGVPLILIWWFAHHDFAGHDRPTRDRQILMSDINYRKWLIFWERIAKEKAGATDSPGALIYAEIAKKDPAMVEQLGLNGGPMTKEMSDLKELPVAREEADRTRKQGIIDAINARVIGAYKVYKDAVTGEPIDEPKYTSDFGKKVCEFWCKKDPDASGPVERQALVGAKVRGHGESKRILVLLDRQDRSQITNEEKKEFNRLVLEAAYPEEILPRAKVYRSNVIDADQHRRLLWLCVLGGAFLVSGCVSLNATSLHSFYRDRLAATFIEPIENDDRTVRLATLDTTAHGAPYFLFSGTLNRKAEDRDPSMLEHDPPHPASNSPPSNVSPKTHSVPEHPGETPTEVFLMSRRYCGSASLGYQPTSEYDGGRLELDDAMAISGAAFSPVQTSNPLIGFLMTIFNMRLGQWLPTPERAGSNRLPLFGPCVHRLLGDWIRERLSMRPQWYFVTDGGHHENLGLWSLLERRCRLIIVSDASQDGGACFADLLRVVRRARFEKGIDIVSISEEFQGEAHGKDGFTSLLELLRFTPLEADESAPQSTEDAGRKIDDHPSRISKRHFVIARIEYPDADEDPSYLIYLKPSLTGDEPADLLGYASLNADFPHNPTLDQLYDEDRFESYRELGEHIGDQLVAELGTPNNPLDIHSFVQYLIDTTRNAQQPDREAETGRKEPPAKHAGRPKSVQSASRELVGGEARTTRGEGDGEGGI